MPLQPLFKPLASRPRPEATAVSELDQLSSLLKDQLTITTFVCAGAAAQAVLFVLPIPAHWKLAPLVLALIYQALATFLPVVGLTRNTYMNGAIPQKLSAQLPDPNASGLETTERGAADSIVVFMLGAQYNHPLGIFSPGAKDLANYFMQMQKHMSENAEHYGLLGYSSWVGQTRSDSNNRLVIYYFRDFKGLHEFAHSKIHRKGWDWWSSVSRVNQWTHLGILHETWCVPKDSWETIYENCTPTLLGAAAIPRKPKGDASLSEKSAGDSTGETQWLRTLVSAKSGPLRNQLGRMAKSQRDVEFNVME